MSLSFSISDSDRATIGKEALNSISSVYSQYFPSNNAIVEIILVDKPAIQKLNLEHRHVDEPTDVLSFPLYHQDDLELSEETLYGSIVICPAKAEEYNETLPQLVHHGLLHVLGHDHETDFNTWSEKEKAIITQLTSKNLEIPPVTQDYV